MNFEMLSQMKLSNSLKCMHVYVCQSPAIFDILFVFIQIKIPPVPPSALWMCSLKPPRDHLAMFDSMFLFLFTVFSAPMAQLPQGPTNSSISDTSYM